MARTWSPTESKLRRLAVADRIGRLAMPVLRALFPPAPRRAHVERVLVTELWHIGDVVLATPFLSALRDVFPRARVTLLAKPHARDVLEASELVDEVIAFEFPWTAPAGKYRPSRYDVRKLTSLFKELRRRRFDVAFDCRMDVRGNAVLYLSGAARRVAHAHGGGAYLLTDAVPVPHFDAHKSDDWLRLLDPFGGAPRVQRRGLTVREEEKARARAMLTARGVPLGDGPLVGVHAGASRDTKRWSSSGFAAAARAAREEFGASVVQFAAPDDSDAAIEGAVQIRLTLRELMATLSLCDAFVCNDSGPMHLAAALGVPVVAVFGSGTKEWYGPLGSSHRLVSLDVGCRPCFAECRFARILCLDIDEAAVVDGLRAQLAAGRGDLRQLFSASSP